MSASDFVEFEELRIDAIGATYRGNYVAGLAGMRLSLVRVLVAAYGHPVPYSHLAPEVWSSPWVEGSLAAETLKHAMHVMVHDTRPSLDTTHLDILAVYGVGYRIGQRIASLRKTPRPEIAKRRSTRGR